MLQGIFFFLHLVISFLIVVIVLLQRSKGGGLSGAFGGMGAGDANFGGIGVTTFLHKATIYLAIGFMVTSVALAYLTAMKSNVDPNAGGGAGATSDIVLPVGDGSAPDAAMPAGDDSTVTDVDAIVPDATDIVPAAVDSVVDEVQDLLGDEESTGGDQ